MPSSTKFESVVIVGATSTIAKAMLTELIGRGVSRAHLIARNAETLDAIRADLTTRYSGIEVSTEAPDLLDVGSICSSVLQIAKELKPDLVLIAHGTMPSQAEQQANLNVAKEQILITGVSPVLWLEAFVDILPVGTFGVIGSVAGDRGRQSNYLYGASKALIETVVEGMQNRFARDKHKSVILLKPGPTKSKMTAGINQRGLANSTVVARRLVEGIFSNRAVVYAPARWRLIMLVLRALPRSVFNLTDL